MEIHKKIGEAKKNSNISFKRFMKLHAKAADAVDKLKPRSTRPTNCERPDISRGIKRAQVFSTAIPAFFDPVLGPNPVGTPVPNIGRAMPMNSPYAANFSNSVLNLRPKLPNLTGNIPIESFLMDNGSSNDPQKKEIKICAHRECIRQITGYIQFYPYCCAKCADAERNSKTQNSGKMRIRQWVINALNDSKVSLESFWETYYDWLNEIRELSDGYVKGKQKRKRNQFPFEDAVPVLSPFSTDPA
jgi:hypothetical protein